MATIIQLNIVNALLGKPVCKHALADFPRLSGGKLAGTSVYSFFPGIHALQEFANKLACGAFDYNDNG